MTFKESYDNFLNNVKTVKQYNIPFIIWLLENPKSPFHLHGAANLHDHDIIHVLLECGHTNWDEAFVIGFTMGNDNRIKKWEVKLFKFISYYFYPEENRFTKDELKVFDSGFVFGRSRYYPRIADFDWDGIDWSRSLKDIQETFGIHANELSYYKYDYLNTKYKKEPMYENF